MTCPGLMIPGHVGLCYMPLNWTSARPCPSGLSTRLAKPLQHRGTELETENSWVGNDWVKMEVLRRFRKTVSVGAEVTSGGRLFQRRLPATGNA